MWMNPLKKKNRPRLIQISFMTQDPNIMTGTIRNPRQNSQLIHDPQCFQNARKNPQSARFFKAKSIDPKTYSPPRKTIMKQCMKR